MRGCVFYGGWVLAERTSPALRATSPFQGEAKREAEPPPLFKGRPRGRAVGGGSSSRGRLKKGRFLGGTS